MRSPPSEETLATGAELRPSIPPRQTNTRRRSCLPSPHTAQPTNGRKPVANLDNAHLRGRRRRTVKQAARSRLAKARRKTPRREGGSSPYREARALRRGGSSCAARPTGEEEAAADEGAEESEQVDCRNDGDARRRISACLPFSLRAALQAERRGRRTSVFNGLLSALPWEGKDPEEQSRAEQAWRAVLRCALLTKEPPEKLSVPVIAAMIQPAAPTPMTTRTYTTTWV
ncbi:hypothetical protein ZWY2020_007422 [Hordeum vulgare]|nr:hypothetical protein ZWY2020_007422 [Hordeum vulgare]